MKAIGRQSRLATAPVPSAMFEAGCATHRRRSSAFAHPTLLPGNRVIPVQSAWKVHALEDVKVPAGSFKALRIAVNDTMAGTLCNEDTFWVDPGQELRSCPACRPVPVRYRDTELLSHTIKRNLRTACRRAAVLCRYAW